MPLTPGTRLGPYEILSALGAGGMGEVYKARDTRLDRAVAIKILSDALATDPEFRERFDREARTISQLDHPHICSLYDVGEHDGTAYLVMQYLEGETLADRLTKGALPLDQALQVAIQIADALAAAHKVGIVHRDLKPGNIMLTKGGARLLDFGLSKPAVSVPGGAQLSMLPTTPPITQQGSILGTFQYMAPEQLEGQDADTRTDIFAFGGVLYEMLTGHKAFDGKTHASLIGAIMHAEPTPLTTLHALTPRALERAVRKCLAKPAEARWQSAADLEDELRWVAETSATALTGVGASAARAGHVRLAWTLVAVTGFVSVVLSIPAFLHLRERPANASEMRLEIATPATSQPLHFALSPDGSRLVLVASAGGVQQLWLRSLATTTAQPLSGTVGAEYPFWSPDSRSIGFFAGGKLKRTDLFGGPPQIVADAAGGRGGAWNDDGTILFAPTNASPLFRVAAAGGPPVVVTKLDLPRQGSHRFPQFLPDNRHFLFFSQGNPAGQGIYLGSLDGSEATRLTPADAAGAYADPGMLVFLQQSTLVSRRLDLANRTLVGDPMAIADGVSYDGSFNLSGISVSAVGRLAYRSGESLRRQLTWFDRTGKTASGIGDADSEAPFSPELSPDGRRVAVTRTVQGNTDIWMVNALRGGATRLTFDTSVDQYGVFSPDGRRMAFSSSRNGLFDLFVKATSGTGGDELLLQSPNVKLALDWSSDERFVLFQTTDSKTGWDLWALPMTGDRKPFAVANAPFEELEGQFSPDGRWVAYQSNESGRFEIYVQPFPGAGGKEQVSTAGGTDPRWRADGRELYFIAPNDTLMAAPIRTMTGSSFEAGSPVGLFPARRVTGGQANLKQQYAVSRDGRFLFNVPVDDLSTAPITLILNWKPALKK
jgi:serine/threonine protein kinase/Tol biopolymer transport system component